MTEYQEQVDRINGAKSDIGAAIAEKGVTVPTGTKIDAMAPLIAAIQKGITLPTLSNEGAASDLLSGKQLIDGEGNIVTGNMASVEQATPSISVSTSGLITASATQSAGKVAAGTKSATKQLTVQAAQTITPGTANKTIASGRYLTGTQTIKGDANLVAANIKKGISIFGVAGSLEAESGGGSSGGTSGGGLIASGSFTPAASTAFQRITHNLGVMPNFAIVMVDNADKADDVGLRSAVAIGLKDPTYPTVALCSLSPGANRTTGGQMAMDYVAGLQLVRFDQTKWATDQLGEYILPGNTIFREATTTQLAFGIFQEAVATMINSNAAFQAGKTYNWIVGVY